ncbi:uncharacterized protein [Scyliorhinus torazame]|uniref:uncharacterized protein n=1 Tax=Scyliorhinus torazame TaxID=75743 RepID=UPI003B5C50B3
MASVPGPKPAHGSQMGHQTEQKWKVKAATVPPSVDKPIEKGSNLVLMANTNQSRPLDQFHWSHNGFEVTVGDRYSVNGKTLRINGVSDADKGIWMCRLYSRGTLADCITYNLQTSVPPSVDKPIEKGSNLVLMANTNQSRPLDQFHWSHNGFEVTGGDRYSVNGKTLRINRVSDADKGIWMCRLYSRGTLADCITYNLQTSESLCRHIYEILATVLFIVCVILVVLLALTYQDYKQLKVKYNQLEQRYNNLQTNNSQLEQRYNQLETNNSQLEQRCNQLETNNSQLEQSYNHLQTNYSQLEQSCNSLQTNYSQLEQSCNSLQTNYSQLEQSYNSLQPTTANWNKATIVYKPTTANWNKATIVYKPTTANWNKATIVYKPTTANWNKCMSKHWLACVCC